jgi:predicted lipoprotein with Yx(FWY)xxD motif
MKRVSILLISAVVFAAGCGSSGYGSSASSSPSSSSSSSAASPPTSAAAAAAPVLATAANAKLGQTILVDAKGMTVYLFAPDGANTASQVPANIKANWPPVTAADAPTAGTGLDAGKLTATAQADGTKQLSYNGHLLYTFVGDKAAGDAAGQGLGGNWFALSAAGDKIG